jgi:tRNA-Thr(GGU) m(6)t(6)A37 methyltransferase TsaA
MYNLTPIGKIHSPLKKLEDCPRQENENAPPAMLEIYPEFLTAAKNIQAGDTLILLTWLNAADRSVMVTHPRNDPNAALTGIFSTRSPDRPNPIGLHRITVAKVVSESVFETSSLEVLDGTPVLDIKPVI